MDEPDEMQRVVIALTDQIEALLPQARDRLGEPGFAKVAGRTSQIRHEALRGVNDKTLLEDKVWLDQKLAELLGLVTARPS